jgi:hypothetical protein
MAFTQTKLRGTYSIGKNVKMGTYAATGVTSGTIVTGLKRVLHFSDSVATANPSTRAVITRGSVALTVTSGQTGTWIAIGE